MERTKEGIAEIGRGPVDAPIEGDLLDRARTRAAREKELSTSVETAYYVPASLGQSPYVALPGVGTIVLRRCGWGC